MERQPQSCGGATGKPAMPKMGKLMYDDLQKAYCFFRSGSTFGQKIAWLFFCATCIQTAFLVPNVAIIPDEPAKVFSGSIMCIDVGGLLDICPSQKSNRKHCGNGDFDRPGRAHGTVSSLFSFIPASSSARAFVILSSGLGGFWCCCEFFWPMKPGKGYSGVCVCSYWQK